MKLSLIISLFIFVSCAGQSSVNRISQSNTTFSGGISGDLKWDDDLDFKRTTWFMGLTTQYDVFIANVSKDSAFMNWFSKGEQKTLEKCNKILVSISSAHRNDLFNDGSFRSQVKESAFEEVNAPNFSRSLKSHSVFQMWHLNRHNVNFFCKSGMLSLNTPLNITVPGFNTIAVY